eukprot:UN00032
MEVQFNSRHFNMDPYVKIRNGTRTFKTKTYHGKDSGYGGKYFEKFTLPVSGPTSITFEVYDKDTFSTDDYEGSVTINLQNPPNGQ